MIVLGIDLGTHTGWALSDAEAGTWDLKPRSHESNGMRLVKFRASLSEVIEKGHVTHVAFEDAAFQPGGNGAAVVYGELLGMLKVVCHDMGVEYQGFKAATIKKFATGKGNANKNLMETAAAKRWPDLVITDDNMADALWIRELALKEWGQ